MKKRLFQTILFAMISWAAQSQPWAQLSSGTAEHLLSIHFTDDNTSYTVGYAGTILKTINGGTNWVPQNSGTFEPLYATCFTNALSGWAVGNNGTIRRTVNGGANWTQVNAPVFADFRAVWFLDANTGFITGGLSNTTATILKTTDGGATWNDISPNTQQAVYGIFFTSQLVGYASDFDGRMLKTVDGGTSWSAQFVSFNNLHGIYFTSPNTGYVAGGNIGSDTGVILKTVNAGNTWSVYPVPQGFLTDIKFFGANKGIAVGGSVFNNVSVLLKTTDAGNSWSSETISTGTTSRQFRVFLPSAQVGYSCGLNGTILKTPASGVFVLPPPGGSTVACVADAQVVPTPPIVTTSCSDPITISGPVVSVDPICSGTKTYTWTYSDCTGTTADWVYTYSITPPTFIMPPSGGSTVACIDDAQFVPNPPAINNSCGVPLTLSNPVVSNDPTCAGTKSYTWTYTDCTGNTADWMYTYTIAPPTFVMPPSGGSTVACIAAAQVVPVPPVVHNSCGEPLSFTGPVVGASPICSGAKRYSWTYIDCTGSTGDWVYTYTIAPPTFIMPPSGGSTVTCMNAAQVVPVPPAINNSCGEPMLLTGPVVSANPICSGLKSYTWTYTDCTGSTADWEYTYTINPPTFTMPASGGSTVNCINAAQLAPTPPMLQNTCGDLLSLSGPVESADPTCSGIKTYRWTYTDCTGSTADWVYTYTISPPTFTMPLSGSSTVNCTNAAHVTPIPPILQNTCGDPLSMTGPIESADPTCFGIKTYRWTYTDCTGSTADWVYAYTISPPTFAMPSSGGSTVNCIAAAQVVPTPPSIQNSCGEPLVMTGPVVSANPTCSGTKTFKWTYTDCTGSAGEWVYTYLIAPTTFVMPGTGGSTVSCAAAQVIPIPPVVQNSCGVPLMISGPIVSVNTTCIGTKTYTWTYTDCTGSTSEWVYTYTILPEPACDEKVINCMKYELLTISENAQHQHTYRIRVTNNCASKLSYFMVQVPNGIQAVKPLNNATYTSDYGRQYLVRNPNASPFNSVRFNATTDSIANGQSDIFEYTLPPQASPTFILVRVRLEPQVFYEAHLNTFYCETSQRSDWEHLEEDAALIFHTDEQSVFSIFPSPTSGLINIELSQPAIQAMSFRIVGLTGQVLMNDPFQAGITLQTIQTNDLPAGLYFLQVISEGKLLATEKFVKQ